MHADLVRYTFQVAGQVFLYSSDECLLLPLLSGRSVKEEYDFIVQLYIYTSRIEWILQKMFDHFRVKSI